MRVRRLALGSLNAVLLAMPVAAIMMGALTLGRYPLSLTEIGTFVLATISLTHLPQDKYDLYYALIVEIRLPRVLAASLVGASLSSSGAAYQAVFRNPLISPGVLGVLNGGAFGAALGLLLDANRGTVQVLCFVMGVIAATLSVSVATVFGTMSTIMLVLGGLISSSLFAALLTLVKYLADPSNQLPTVVFWLMGSFSNVDLFQFGWVVAPMMLGIVTLTAFGRGLDALSMGDDEAKGLGIPTNTVRYSVIVAATLVSALTVTIAGVIGWIGLLVPHLARLIVGPLNTRLIPVSASIGAIILVLADALSRSFGTVELPVGIVTELLGIPAFLLVLRRARRSWL